MPVKTTWIDPNSGKEYSYNWGFDVDSTIPKKKNYTDYFGWNDFERDINKRMNGKELETSLKRRMSNTMYRVYSNNVNCKGFVTPQIKNVIFNPPATIVFWTDGTKTVVKCQNGEAFDPEKGITMAFFKKMNGNKGHYFEEIKKWTEGYINSNGVEVAISFNNWSEAAEILDKIVCLRKDNDDSCQSN